jgi:hypothetical protein
MKAALSAVDLLTALLLAAILARRGLDPARAILYAWHPLPIWEISQNGHVDALVLLLLVAALFAAERGGRASAGSWLSLAALVKFYPVTLAPAFVRRGGLAFVAAFAATTVLAYVPYLSVGAGVIGFLPHYFSEEPFASGETFWTLRLLRFALPLPTAAYLALSAGALLALALHVARRGGERPARDAATLAIALMVLTTPRHPWYWLWLLPLVCLEFSAAGFLVANFAPLLYWAGSPRARALLYAQPLIVVGLLLGPRLARRWRAARSGVRAAG